MVVGAWSPVDWMCMTRKPAIATLFMDGTTAKQIALGCSTNQNVVVSRPSPQPLFPSTISTQTIKTTVTRGLCA